MNCKSCGAPRDPRQVLCPWCGTSTYSEPDTRPHTHAWHQRTLVYHYRRNEGGSLTAVDGQDSLAQQSFWNHLTRTFLDDLEIQMTDHGWTPLGTRGPSCVELDTYSTLDAWDFLATVTDVFSDRYHGEPRNPWRSRVKSITLKYRRQTNGPPRGETWHYWLTDGEWLLHEQASNGLWHPVSNLAPYAVLAPQS